MVRKLIQVFLMICLLFVVINACTCVWGHNPGYEVVAVYGLTPAVDGHMNAAEWADASAESLDDNTTLYVKQDGVNLYAGFNVSDSTYSLWDSIGIYVDVDNNAGGMLQPDDIALAAYRNGSIAEGNVTDNTWGFTVVSGWTAQVYDHSSFWQVEFNVTYTKIDVVAGVEKTVGAAFLRSNNGAYPSTWPSTGFNYLVPETWGDITSTGYDWIPEFPSLVFLPLFMVAAILTAIVYIRKSPTSSRIVFWNQ